MVNDLDYEGSNFLVSKKDYSKIEQKIFVLMYFVMKMVLRILFMYQSKNMKII